MELISKARDVVIPKSIHTSSNKHTYDRGNRHTTSKSNVLRNDNLRGSDHPSEKGYEKQANNKSSKLRCYGCGQPGVVKSKCSTCKTNASSVTNKVDFQSADQYSVESDEVMRAIVEVDVVGRRGVAVLDSGATHSLASPGLYNILRGSGVLFTAEEYNIRLADGTHPASNVLYRNTHIKVRGRELPISFLELPEAGNKTLLGNDFMKEAGIVIDVAQAS